MDSSNSKFRIYYLLPLCIWVLPLTIFAKQLHPLLTTRFWPSLLYTLVLGFVVSLCVVSLSYVFRNYSKVILLLVCVSPVSLSVLVSIWFEKSVIWQTALLALVNLPIATLLVAERWAARPYHYDDLLKLLEASRWQQLRLNVGWLAPNLLLVTGFTITYVLGDIAVASMLAPSNLPSAMQIAMQLLGSYRFHYASSALFYIVILSGIVYYLAYAYRKPA